MACRRSRLRFCCRTRCGLAVTLLLIQSVGQTTPKAQYPVSGGQIPPYEVQHPYPGVDTSRDGNGGTRRLDGQELRSLLQRVDVMLANQCTKNVAAQWQFETNVNLATQQAAVSLFHPHPGTRSLSVAS
jgi:hypothetical protein